MLVDIVVVDPDQWQTSEGRYDPALCGRQRKPIGSLPAMPLTQRKVRELAARHAETETVLVFSHGDPIKAVLADAFGMRLDDFQRIHVSPAGISIIDYRGDRPFVMCVNAGDDPTSMLAAPTGPAVGGGDVSKPA